MLEESGYCLNQNFSSHLKKKFKNEKKIKVEPYLHYNWKAEDAKNINKLYCEEKGTQTHIPTETEKRKMMGLAKTKKFKKNVKIQKIISPHYFFTPQKKHLLNKFNLLY